jgi:predicted DCC family thiol-disulfide oxidoreductase YuxK
VEQAFQASVKNLRKHRASAPEVRSRTTREIPTARTTVEERPFQGRVTILAKQWALALRYTHRNLSMPHPILLYDGVCGLCNRLVQFILRRDREAIFRFASLQSAFAARILARQGASSSDLDTVYVVVNHDLPDEYLLSRSQAVLFVLKQLGGPWSLTASVLRLLPKFLRDPAYNTVARHRYRIWGRSEVCALPPDQEHSRFLDR